VIRRRCRHLIGDPVRFLFVLIPRLANRKLVLPSRSLLPAGLLASAIDHRVASTRALALEQMARERRTSGPLLQQMSDRVIPHAEL
jgi:hypothetical protein